MNERERFQYPDQIDLITKLSQLPRVLSWKRKISLGVAVLTTAAFLIACSTKPVQSLETPTPRLHPIVIQLNSLNMKLIDNLETIKEVGPQISNLATDYYCQELNCNSNELARLKNSFNFLENEDFQKKSKETNHCTDQQQYDLESGVGGFYFFKDQKIYLNIERLLKQQNGNLRTNPVYTIFDFSLHELGHARPPVLKQLENNQFVPFTSKEEEPPKTIVHGVIRLIYTPSRNVDGKPCYIAYRYYVEEAVVDDNNERLLRKLNLPQSVVLSKQATRNYQQLINIYFQSDHSPLLNFHQKSQESNFVGNIGLALGHPRSLAVAEGDRFLATYFVPN